MRRIAVLLVPVLLLSGCSAFGGLDGTGEKGYISGDGAIVQRAVELAKDAGDFGSLEELRGKPVGVTVWGSWCAPCVAEATDVVDAAEELGDDATFVGINLRESSPAMGQAFERNYDVPFPSFYSPDGREMLAFQGVLTPRSIPSFVVLDAEGRVAASINGGLPSTQTLVDLVRDAGGGAARG